MNTITITVSYEQAARVYNVVPNIKSIATAIENATYGKQEDENVSITISKADVRDIYQNLTVLPEGEATKDNDTLLDVLLPIVQQDAELAALIVPLQEANELKRQAVKDEGKAALRRAHLVMANNRQI